MKFAMMVKAELEAIYIKAECGVRYWEDGTLNGKDDEDGKMPCRDGDLWCPTIEIETGMIVNWAFGNTAQIHYKCCDAGTYALLDSGMNVLTEVSGYVPKAMCVGDNGYGDYVIMEIDESGHIEGWNPNNIDAEEFVKNVD